MFRKITIVISLIALSLTVLACDSKVAGISGTTQVSALDQEQTDALCEHLGETIKSTLEDDAFKKANCLMSAAMGASFASEDEGEQITACEESLEECMAEEDEEEEEFDFTEGCLPEEDRESCEATVTEVDACFSAMFDAQLDQMKGMADVSCEDAITGDALDDMMGGSEEEVEECKAIEDKCDALN